MFKKVMKVTAIVVGCLLLIVGGFFGWFFYQMRELEPLDSTKISDSIFVIKGGMGNMYLVKNNDAYVAFDAADNPKKILEECKALSIDPSMVKAVFLTHSDADHVDGLTVFPLAKVYLSKDEVPLLKEKNHRHFLGMSHMNKLPVADYITLSDGDSVVIDGITINAIATPGHTQGSMCFRVGDALFVGDLCTIVNDQVRLMLKIFTEDMTIDGDSIRKIAKLNNYKTIYTAHCGYTKDLDNALKEWR
jgi:glyoxylase-like metal-dependent hydrolase (beta-lactamase superfamily II)